MDALQRFWNQHVRGSHQYQVHTPIARLQPSHDREARLHEAEQYQASAPTPGSSSLPATPAGTRNRIPWLGTVTSTHHAEPHRVVNVTHDDHLLHPGTVSGHIEERDGVIYSVRTGEGSGRFPSLNNWFSPLVWNAADHRLAERMNPRYAEERSRISWDVMMHADPSDPDATTFFALRGVQQTAQLRRYYVGA
jgi:hypothetical protein